LLSLYGVIDEGYQNEVLFACRYLQPYCSFNEYIEVKPGDRIAQLVPVKRQEMSVSRVSDEEYEILTMDRAGARGTGGFGSTGEK
jgi:dUTPase